MRGLDERDPSAIVPSPTALAATWDEQRIERRGQLLAAEARRKGVDALLALDGFPGSQAQPWKPEQIAAELP